MDVEYDLAKAISDDESLRDLIQIEGDLTAKLNFTLDFKITIGIDRSKASATAGAYVSFDNAPTIPQKTDSERPSTWELSHPSKRPLVS